MDIDSIFRWISEHLGLVIFLAWLLEPVLKRVLRKRGESKSEDREDQEQPAPVPQQTRKAPEPSPERNRIPEVPASEPEELIRIANFRARVLAQRERALALKVAAQEYTELEGVGLQRLDDDIELLGRIAVFTEYLRHESDLKNLTRIYDQILARINRLDQIVESQRMRFAAPIVAPPVIISKPVPRIKTSAPHAKRDSFRHTLIGILSDGDSLEEAMALGAVMRRPAFPRNRAGF